MKAGFWKQTRLVQLALIGFLLGLGLAKWNWVISPWLVLSALILLPLAIKLVRWRWLIIGLTTLALGLWRGQLYQLQLSPLKAAIGSKVEFTATVTDDTVFTDNRQSEFHVKDIVFMPGYKESAGRVTVRGFASNKISRGDIVKVKGKLFATRGGSQARISFATIETLAHHVSWLENIRLSFMAGSRTALPEPHGSLGLGFLIGGRAALPPELEQQLSLVGLTHIVAVSGFNLTILVRFTRRLLAGFSKYAATATAVGLILIFIAVTGNSPSIARASVVSLLALAAWYYGRPLKPSIILLLSACLTAAYRPTYLWSDIGWYLSFLAFIGVLIVAPTVNLRFRLGRQAWLQILIETLCAQILTLPLIIYVFGQASVISPLSNLVILPLIPLAMLLTVAAGLAGVFFAAFAGWLAWPARWLLEFMIVAIQKFAAWPAASVKIQIAFLGMLITYAAIVLVVWVMRKYLPKADLVDVSVIK